MPRLNLLLKKLLKRKNNIIFEYEKYDETG